MTSRCPDCDKPIATNEDERTIPEGKDEHLCWRRWNLGGPDGFCMEPRVDWRARALAAEACIDVDPADVIAVAAENDRLLAAFDEAIKKLRAGRSLHSGFCTWCGQHWPHLDGETYEVFRKYTMEHAATCPANDIRIERDRLRAEVAAYRKGKGA